MEKLVLERKNVEAEEKILKKILNIEEEHKKHGSIISGGIRKIFGTKVKDQRHKEEMASDYSKSIVQLKQMISKSNAEREDLESKLKNQNKQLALMKEENNHKNREYSHLEDELYNFK